MLKYYVITFTRTVERCTTEHRFFCYAKNRLQAIKRFCGTTGYKTYCIVSVSVLDLERKVGEIETWE